MSGPTKSLSNLSPPKRMMSVSSSEGAAVLENRRKSTNGDSPLSSYHPKRSIKSVKSFSMTSEGRPAILSEKDKKWHTVNTQVFGLPGPTRATKSGRSRSMGLTVETNSSPSSRRSSFLSTEAVETLNMVEANKTAARSPSTTTDLIKDKLAKLTLMKQRSSSITSLTSSPATAVTNATEGPSSPIHNVYSPDDDVDSGMSAEKFAAPNQGYTKSISRTRSSSVVESAIEGTRSKTSEDRSFFLKEDTVDVTGGLNKKKKHPHYVRISLAESEKGPVTIHLVRKMVPGNPESGSLFVMSSIMVLSPTNRTSKNALGTFVSSVKFDFLNQKRDSFTPVFNVDITGADLKGSGDIIALRRCDVPGRKDIAMMVQVSLAAKMKHTKLCHVVFQVYYIEKPKIVKQPSNRVTEEEAVSALTLSSEGIELVDDRELPSMDVHDITGSFPIIEESREPNVAQEKEIAPPVNPLMVIDFDNPDEVILTMPPSKKRQMSSAYEEDCVPFYLQYLRAASITDKHFGIRRVDL